LDTFLKSKVGASGIISEDNYHIGFLSGNADNGINENTDKME